MADAFAPKLSSDVAFERPVEMPSVASAIADIGSEFAGFFRSERRAANTAVKVDPNLGVFRQGLERVEAVRQERGEAAALIAERQLASNFAMAGIDLGTEYKSVYETTTGRPWAGYGMDNEARIMQETLNKPEVQASYVASFAINQDWTEEERIEYAIGQQASIQAAANEIARAKSTAGYQWSVQTEAAYGTAIDNFLNTNLGGLVAVQKSGGRVGPQAIANLQASWSQLKVNLSRPSNVGDDQWKATQDRISNIDAMLTTLQRAQSSDVMLEEITTGFANAIIEQGGASPESLLAGATALKDVGTLTNLMGGKVETLLMDLSKGFNVNVSSPQLFSHVLQDQSAITGQEDPNAFLNALPRELAVAVEGKTAEQIFNGLNASGRLVSLVGQNDLNRPEARQQFVVEASKIGAAMMGAQDGQFLSNEFLRQLVANPGFLRNVKTLEGLSPDDALTVRKYVRSGLNAELARQRRNLQSIEAQNNLVWNGSSYGEGQITQAMIEGMEPMPAGTTFNATVLQQAYDRRASIDTISRTLGELAVPVPEGQATPAGGDTLSLIRSFEGFTTNAYWDVNAYRGGYGSDTITRADGTVESVTPNTIFTREDAERDLARRAQEFAAGAEKKIGKDVWANLAPNVKAALTSIAYNYGSIPDRLMPAIRSGSIDQIAQAVEGLAGDNDGINRRRRLQEAAIIRGESTIPNYTPQPASRGTSMRPEDVAQAMPPAPQPMAEPVSAPVASPQPTPAEVEMATPEASPQPTEAMPQEAGARQAEQPAIPDDIRRLIQNLGGNPDATVRVNNTEELYRLIDSGEVSEGDLVVIGDMLQVVTRTMVEAR